MSNFFKIATKPLLSSYFLIGILLYITVRLGRLGYFHQPSFINDYLTDLLCMPIILTLCLVGTRLIKRLPNLMLNAAMIYGMTVFYAFLFEFILPKQSANYTADIIDVIMYFIGATFFWSYWLFNEPQ